MLLSCSHSNKPQSTFSYKPLVIALSLLAPTVGHASEGWYQTLFDDGTFTLANANEISGMEEWDKDSGDHKTSYEAMGALNLDYESGYVGDKNLSMGFGLGAAFVYKLSQRNPDTSLGGTSLGQTDCAPDPSDDNKVYCGDTTNDAKLSQINVRIKAGKKRKRSLESTIGLGYFEAGMIKSFDPEKDLMPTTYSGFEVKGTWDDIDLSAALVTGMMKGGANSIDKLVYQEDKAIPTGESIHIDHVAGISLTHKLDSFAYTLGYSYAEGYKQRYLAHANYKMDVTPDSELRFDAAYNLNLHKGKNWDEAIEKGIEDEGKDKSHLTSARIRYQYRDDFRLGLGWSTTGGNMGFNRYLGGVDALWVSYGQGYVEKFRGVDNTSQRFEAVYWLNDFDTPIVRDLRLRYQYIWGEDEHAGPTENQTGKVYEHVFDVVYTKPSGRFAGTMVSLKAGKLFADDIWAKVGAGDPSDQGDVGKFKMTVTIPII